jgi:hypothetical protein
MNRGVFWSFSEVLILLILIVAFNPFVFNVIDIVGFTIGILVFQNSHSFLFFCASYNAFFCIELKKVLLSHYQC